MCVLCDCRLHVCGCTRKPEEGDRTSVAALQAVVRHLPWVLGTRLTASLGIEPRALCMVGRHSELHL